VVSSSATAIQFPEEPFVWPDNTTIKYTERACAGAARSPARRQDHRLDARWLAEVLARELLPESWIPPMEI
jgi:hypothetical protein